MIHRVDQPTGWSGNFANGDHLLWTFNGGPLTITLRRRSQPRGGWKPTDSLPSTASSTPTTPAVSIWGISVFSGLAADIGQTPVFIGVRDMTGANIKSIRFDTTTGGTPEDFAINQVSLDALPLRRRFKFRIVQVRGAGMSDGRNQIRPGGTVGRRSMRVRIALRRGVAQDVLIRSAAAVRFTSNPPSQIRCLLGSDYLCQRGTDRHREQQRVLTGVRSLRTFDIPRFAEQFDSRLGMFTRAGQRQSDFSNV